MTRREFINMVGGSAIAWPLVARAQQARVARVGLLNGVSFGQYERQLGYIRQGVMAVGFREGQNVAIEYRSAEGQYDRLPASAAELAQLNVDVILAVGSTNSPQAAKVATSTIPIVFAVGTDP